VTSLLEGEFSENEFREDWTVSERVAILRSLERHRHGGQVVPRQIARDEAAAKVGFGSYEAGSAGAAPQHIATLPQNIKAVVACFPAAGILMALGVCLYAGYLAKKPSQRATDAVRTILSFSFGIVTGVLGGS
jgi:hypothetical protein